MSKLLDHEHDEDELGWEWCENSIHGRLHCEHGCCGDGADQHCCMIDDETAGVIIFFLLIAFVLCIIAGVVACCVCAFKKQLGRSGQVLHNRTTAVIATSTFGPQPPLPAQQPFPQQQFPMATHPAPEPHQTSPAYPSVPPPTYQSATPPTYPGFQPPYPTGT